MAVCRDCVLLFSALADILSGEQWVGCLTAPEMAVVDAAVSALCRSLRPEAVALAEAFDVPDRILNSALGRSDGRVYEAL